MYYTHSIQAMYNEKNISIDNKESVAIESSESMLRILDKFKREFIKNLSRETVASWGHSIQKWLDENLLLNTPDPVLHEVNLYLIFSFLVRMLIFFFK